MEIMDAREALEDAQSEADVERVKADNEGAPPACPSQVRTR